MQSTSFWKRLSFWKRFGEKDGQGPDQGPAREDIATQGEGIPGRIEFKEGQLALDIHDHVIQLGDRSLACWTFVSEGLVHLDQRELVFTIPHEAGSFERWASTICHLCATVARFAEEGKLVDEGGVTLFGPSGFPGQPRIKGLGFMPTFPIQGLDIDPDALTVIPLLDDEAEAFRGHGLWRVASRVGHHHGYYPYIPWWDLDRPPMSARNPAGESLLDSIPASGRAPGVTITKGGDEIVLQGSKDARKRLARLLKEAPEVFALVPDLNERCDGLLVWQPGQSEPVSISPEGSKRERIAVCALVLMREQESSEVKLVEDGAAALLTRENWQALEQALHAPAGRHLVAQGPQMRLWIEGETEPS